MSTTKQKTAARKNLGKARAAQKKKSSRTKSAGLSTADKNALKRSDFAFPEERKEPLVDAKHVRNAISRFDQVEGVTDAERDAAWKRIEKAAKRFGVEVSETSWHELFEGRKATKKKGGAKKGKKATRSTKKARAKKGGAKRS